MAATPIPPRDFMDRGASWLLESPGNLRGLLLAAVPRLAGRFDYGRVQVLPRTFIDEEFRKLEADFVAKVPYRPRDGSRRRSAWVYALIEHQTNPDRLIPFRLLKYMVRIWSAELEEQRAAARGRIRLSPILPLVWYTGSRRWESPGGLEDLMEAPRELLGFIPRWDSVFLNVGEMNPARLRAIDDPMGRLLVLLRERFGSRREEIRALEEAMEQIVKLGGEGAERSFRILWYVVGWIEHRRPAGERQALVEVVKDSLRDPERVQEVENMAKTHADLMMEEGIRKGLQEGRQEGEVIVRRKTLLRLLRAKFGAVSDEAARRLESIEDAARLDELLDRILTATSLAQMNL